jgi:ubiquinone/menaquinone biosynthesis C-methylase UbiE
MKSYSHVTELPEELVPQEQLLRITERYLWASGYSNNKDVLECACGAGQGAKMLNAVSRSYVAGDIDKELVKQSQENNPNIKFKLFDATNMPFPDESFDVVLICEAIYYIPDISKFLQETRRVLRKNGKVLIVSANSSLFDFNPSLFTYNYPTVIEMGAHFKRSGFKYISVEGGTKINSTSLRQRLLRPIKFIASQLNIIPKTMKGKSWLKKLFFGGKFVMMPKRINCENKDILLESLDVYENNTDYKVLYFIGEK